MSDMSPSERVALALSRLGIKSFTLTKAAALLEKFDDDPKKVALANDEVVETALSEVGVPESDQKMAQRVKGACIEFLTGTPTPAVEPPKVEGGKKDELKVVVDLRQLQKPGDMSQADLMAAFATAATRTPEVTAEIRARYTGTRPLFVVDAGGTVDLAKSFQRLEDEDDSEVYDGLMVLSADEVLDKEFDADPLNSTKLRKGLKADDGVKWPKNREARVFVIFCRRNGEGGLTPGMDTPARATLASSLEDFPKVPSYLEDALVKFNHAKAKKPEEISACEAEMRFNPHASRSAPAPTRGGGQGGGGGRPPWQTTV